MLGPRDRIVNIPYEPQTQFRFPPRCVYCLAPSATLRDLVITAEIPIDTGRYWEHRFRSFTETLRIPYCEDHSKQSAKVEEALDSWTTRLLRVALAVTILIEIWISIAGIHRGSLWEELLAFVIIFAGVSLVMWTFKQIVSRVLLRWRFGDTLAAAPELFPGMLGIRGGFVLPLEEKAFGGYKYTDTKPRSIKLEFKHSKYAYMFAEINGFPVTEVPRRDPVILITAGLLAVIVVVAVILFLVIG